MSSIVLDSLRILAALTVLIYHIYAHWFILQTVDNGLDKAAHTAVIVFFVLSGFVISYTTERNNRGGFQYMQARFSRLYSIVLPALLITAVCEYLVKVNDSTLFSTFTRGTSWPRYLMSGLFLNEIWFFSSAPPMNSPLWSLSYEFWYYVIFGFWFYWRKSFNVKSLILPVLSCLLAGPKILLMMPCWLVGYIAYKLPKPNYTKSKSNLIVFLCFFLAILFVGYISPLPYKMGKPPLVFASQFFTDWITAFFIGFALWILPLEYKHKQQSKWVSLIRAAADLTFPLYVLHNPLLILYDAIFKNTVYEISQLWKPSLLILIVSVILGVVLEKQRYLWSRLFNFLVFHLKVRLSLLKSD